MDKRKRGKEVKGKKTKDKPRCKIYLFTEGKTEKIYLKHYENKQYNVEIVPVADAIGIVKFAKEYIDKEELDLKLGDRGYCVFDSDPRSNPDINTAFDLIRGSERKGLKCIFSNPCFEVWFVMHFMDAPYGLTATKMKSEIKKIVKPKYHNYCETTDIYEYLEDKQNCALKRAKILHNSQEKVQKSVLSHECNPYTNMFEFIEYMEVVRKDNKL